MVKTFDNCVISKADVWAIKALKKENSAGSIKFFTYNHIYHIETFSPCCALTSCAYPISRELLYRILYKLLLWLHVLAPDEISGQLSLEISLDNPDIESPKIAEIKVFIFVNNYL